MKKLIFLAIITALFASCCACSIKYKHAAKPLKGTTWTLIQKNGMAVEAKDSYNFMITEDGKLSGKGDCNQMMGEYIITSKNKIKFSSIATTRAMCQNPQMESEFIEIFNKADSYSMDLRLLMLFSNGELLGVFESEK